MITRALYHATIWQPRTGGVRHRDSGYSAHMEALRRIRHGRLSFLYDFPRQREIDLQRPRSICMTNPGTLGRVDRAPPPEVSDRGSLPSALKDSGAAGSASGEAPLSLNGFSGRAEKTNAVCFTLRKRGFCPESVKNLEAARPGFRARLPSRAHPSAPRINCVNVIMTPFAFILGCVPLWTASGSGAVAGRVERFADRRVNARRRTLRTGAN